jgi:hypothetical protein
MVESYVVDSVVNVLSTTLPELQSSLAACYIIATMHA